MEQISKAVIGELVPTGELRAAINFGNPVLAQRPSPPDGSPGGVTVALARELATRLGVPLRLIPFDAAGKVFEAAKSDVWDVAFLARDPARATEILFTAPYVIIEATYLIKADAPFQSVDDLDQPGVRIAVGRGAAYELYLQRTLKNAELVRSDTSDGACDQFLEKALDAVAGVRQPLLAYAGNHGGLRVLDDRITVIEQSMGTPKGRPAAKDYLQAFIEEMKRNGFVARALERSGQREACVAPPCA